MRLSELLNRPVRTESGKRLGRVHDIRGELHDGQLRLTGLVAGTPGLLERLGIGTHGSGGAAEPQVRGHETIPWERISHIGREIVVRDEPET
jgi:sporulation protein YlmC with PRC-barrel domain